jgi:hypothetical protein
VDLGVGDGFGGFSGEMGLGVGLGFGGLDLGVGLGLGVGVGLCLGVGLGFGFGVPEVGLEVDLEPAGEDDVWANTKLIGSVTNAMKRKRMRTRIKVIMREKPLAADSNDSKISSK